jgi:hypothetical protein
MFAQGRRAPDPQVKFRHRSLPPASAFDQVTKPTRSVCARGSLDDCRPQALLNSRPMILPIADAGPWDFGWTAVAGIATSILAFVTWLLARSTSQDVQAAWRPVLVIGDHPESGQSALLQRETDENGDPCTDLRCRVENAGSGPAINCKATGWIEGNYAETITGLRDTIPVKGFRDLDLRAASKAGLGSHNVTISYEDIAGNRFETTFLFQGAMAASGEPRMVYLLETQVPEPKRPIAHDDRTRNPLDRLAKWVELRIQTRSWK